MMVGLNYYWSPPFIWTLLILGHVTSRIWCLVPESLDECERQGKHFCYTGIAPDRHRINKAIRNDPNLLAIYQRRAGQSIDGRVMDDDYYNSWNTRRRREASTDCSSLCCVKTDTTGPYSFFRDKDGWQQVATTPEFPLRAAFYTETCTNRNSPCRGVKSADGDYQPICEQVEFRHAILVYNRTLGGVQTRYVTVPSGCRCKLSPKNPFKQQSTTAGTGHG